MKHEYDTCIRYDMYSIRRYVYFENNRIWYVIDMWNIINISLSIANVSGQFRNQLF